MQEDHDASGRRLFDYARVCDGVLVGRVPRNSKDLCQLREREGVVAVVTFSEGWELCELGWPDNFVKEAGMKWLHLVRPRQEALFLFYGCFHDRTATRTSSCT